MFLIQAGRKFFKEHNKQTKQDVWCDRKAVCKRFNTYDEADKEKIFLKPIPGIKIVEEK